MRLRTIVPVPQVKSEGRGDAVAAFERRLSEGRSDHYDLRLYVAGTTPRSMRAVQNITRLCEAEMPGRYNLDIIDVYQQPARASEDQIVALPTLVKELPLPRRKLVGDLSREEQVRKGLGLPPAKGTSEH
ncbi:MAG: circadian clock KaiB family protein [Bryobacteraceae bacterium]